MFFIEKFKKTYDILKQNVTGLTEASRTHLHFGDGIEWLQNRSFNDDLCLFLIDPPYQSGLFESVIKLVSEKTGIAKGSILVIESDKKSEFKYPKNLELVRQKTFNKTRLDILELI